jgi:hypothetical protein
MMNFGGRQVRAKLVALLLVLVAFWSYSAYLSGRDALEVLRVRALDEALGQPTDQLILGLQAERRLTVGALAEPGQPRAELTAQRDRTDRSVSALRAFTHDTGLRLTGAGAVRDRARDLVGRLDGIAAIRQDVDAGRLDRTRAASAYDGLVDAGFGVYSAQWAGRETDAVEATRAVIALARAREILAREDTLVSGALAAADELSAAGQRRLGELVATQRFARAEAAAGLPATVRADYQRLVTGAGFTNLGAVEDRLLRPDGADAPAPVGPQAWQAAVGPALADLAGLVTHGVRDGVERATAGATGVIVRTGLVVGLGLLAVLAAIVGSVRTTRRLADRLRGVRSTAEELAEQELPDIARRLRRGEPVDPPAEPSPPDSGADQIDQAGRAIDAARVAAIRAVLAEAESHKGTWDLFLQLTRRNQSLLRDQLGLLDAMERRERDTEDLADLFRIDHLASRIRRNVEKLITMAGATPARRWRRPVPLLDVVRGAVAEVADYPRVLLAPNWTGALAGPVVPDVIHLLAELIENGLTFSAESTTVRVGGEPREGGCAIVVTDDGPGMSGAAMADANELLRNPPRFRPPGTGHGLYAVGLIARRRGIVVELRAAQRGGTHAEVLLPAGRLVDSAGGGVGGPTGQTAEYRFPPGGAPAAVPAVPDGTVRDTPGGLPVRARDPGPSTAPTQGSGPSRRSAPPPPAPPPPAPPQRSTPPGLPERVPRGPLAAPDRPGGAGGPGMAGTLPVRRAAGPHGIDGSETMEMPIALSAGDRPEPNGPPAPPQAAGPGPSTHPTRIGGGSNGSERTTSGSANGHDR